MQGLEAKYPQLKVSRFEVYQNESNALLLFQLFDKFSLPSYERGVPAVFIADTYFVGNTPIIENLENKVKECIQKGCTLAVAPAASPGPSGGVVERKTASPSKAFNPITLFATITGAALVDSINPCAIAVLLILLTALLAVGERRRALRAGLAFILSVYIVYFLFGLGIFSALQLGGVSYYFYLLVGWLAIIVGVLNVKDYFWYGAGGFVTEIPMSWRPRLKALLQNVTSPAGAFLIGFAVCLFELPCTGGPYFFALGLLAEQVSFQTLMPLLLYYNLLFVAPLIVLTIAVYRGLASVEKAEEFRQRKIRLLHLAAGLVMIALGVVTLFHVF
jgi:cytochrome c biogenesis protein CcdA